MNCINTINTIQCHGLIEVVIRQYKKPSTNEQRRRMFGYVVSEIAEQAWLEGRQYSAKVWHEYLKEKFLPLEYMPGITREGYVKYLEMPDGNLKLVGSTTELTTRGHKDYVTACEAFGAELGVKFSANES